MNRLGVSLFCGENNFNDTVYIDEANYFSIYNNNDLPLCKNLDVNGLFQTKEITNMIYQYLREEDVCKRIMENNPFIL